MTRTMVRGSIAPQVRCHSRLEPFELVSMVVSHVYARLPLHGHDLACWRSDLPCGVTTAGTSTTIALMMQDEILKGGDAFWSTETQHRSNAYFEGRETNMDKFKPGVETVILIFSDQKATKVFRFPWYERLKPLLEPIVEKVSC